MHWPNVIKYFGRSTAALEVLLEDRGGHEEPELSKQAWREAGSPGTYWQWLHTKLVELEEELARDSPYR